MTKKAQQNLQNDSREVCAGDIFLAYPGGSADGRLFISDAIAAGASQIFYEPDGAPDLKVLRGGASVDFIAYPGLAKRLGEIASQFYEVPRDALRITGVTGTNGKTTIAYQLAQAYDLLGLSSAYMGTLGAGFLDDIKALHNTTPDALCVQKTLHHWVDAGVAQVAMEVSSHGLSEGRVDEVVFNQAIYTNLSHDHLDYHKTIEAYAEAKSRLFAYESLAHVILNQDDAYADVMRKRVPRHTHIITYGLQPTADITAEQIALRLTGSVFKAKTPLGEFECVVQALGEFNIYNSLAVIASLIANGYALSEIQSVMPKLVASPGRMELVAASPVVLVDYAHTPDALEKALSTLAALKKSKLMVVFGCGGGRDKEKRVLMARAAEQYADEIIMTSDNPRTEDPHAILKDIASGFSPKAQVLQIENRKDAIQAALSRAGKDDIILIAGKGHETYQEINGERFLFSDAAVVRELMA